jgi:hypothetical protein
MVLGRPRIAIMYVSKVRIVQNNLFRVSLSTESISAGWERCRPIWREAAIAALMYEWQVGIDADE